MTSYIKSRDSIEKEIAEAEKAIAIEDAGRYTVRWFESGRVVWFHRNQPLDGQEGQRAVVTQLEALRIQYHIMYQQYERVKQGYARVIDWVYIEEAR